MTVTIDALAQEIRRVDGNHSLGAGALAEALMPFLSRALAAAEPSQPVDPDDKPIISLCLYDLITLAKADGVRSVIDPNYTDRSFVDEPSYRFIIDATTPTPSPADRGAVERRWIADPKPDGALWHKAFDTKPECHTAFYREWVPADTIAALALPAAEGVNVGEAWEELCNADDRTSPEDYPDMCLIKREELAEFMRRAALAAPSQAREG